MNEKSVKLNNHSKMLRELRNPESRLLEFSNLVPRFFVWIVKTISAGRMSKLSEQSKENLNKILSISSNCKNYSIRGYQTYSRTDSNTKTPW